MRRPFVSPFANCGFITIVTRPSTGTVLLDSDGKIVIGNIKSPEAAEDIVQAVKHYKKMVDLLKNIMADDEEALQQMADAGVDISGANQVATTIRSTLTQMGEL